VSLRDLLPSRDHYTSGCHPGTDLWRHARTALTPEWPRWIGEGSSCDGAECDGKRTTYKLSASDTGLDVVEDYAETGTTPDRDATAGGWICDGAGHHSGIIGLDEVQHHCDDIPPALPRGLVLPLFGPREVDRA
jgi:hypothetical protein